MSFQPPAPSRQTFPGLGGMCSICAMIEPFITSANPLFWSMHGVPHVKMALGGLCCYILKQHETMSAIEFTIEKLKDTNKGKKQARQASLPPVLTFTEEYHH